MTDAQTIEAIGLHLEKHPGDLQARRELIDLLMDAGRDGDVELHQFMLMVYEAATRFNSLPPMKRWEVKTPVPPELLRDSAFDVL